MMSNIFNTQEVIIIQEFVVNQIFQFLSNKSQNQKTSVGLAG